VPPDANIKYPVLKEFVDGWYGDLGGFERGQITLKVH
jgi:hypothetical protein